MQILANIIMQIQQLTDEKSSKYAQAKTMLSACCYVLIL